MLSTTSSDANHPALGLGGRSLELSLALGREVDPEAFELAAQELHDHVMNKDVSPADLLDAGRWLLSLTDMISVDPPLKDQVIKDVTALTE